MKDPLKFSKRSPKEMALAYKRIWDLNHGINGGAPTSKRICEDINRILDKTYLSIVAARGRALYGLHTCTGRRKQEIGSKGGRHGGSPVKNKKDDIIEWVHPDVTHLLESVVCKY